MKKILITVSIFVVIYMLLKKDSVNFDSTLQMYYDKYFTDKNVKITGNIDNDVNNWILLKEGGISTNKNDSASNYPLKGKYIVNGVTYVDPHTNKGITYKTFVDTLPKLGLTPTPQLFLSMPNDLVFKIYKKNYADAYNENSGNKMIDHMLGLWAWGSGVGGEKLLVDNFIKLKGKSLNKLYNENKQKLFDDLTLYRIEFYKKLAEKKPQNQQFLKGWINSALNFHHYFNYYI